MILTALFVLLAFLKFFQLEKNFISFTDDLAVDIKTDNASDNASYDSSNGECYSCLAIYIV